MPTFVDLAKVGPDTGMQRLSSTKIVLEPGEKTERLCYEMHEAVYYIISGYTLFTMSSSGADFTYSMQQASAMWLSDSAEHYLYNDGAVPMECICFKIRVDQSKQTTGKEVQRRMVDLNTVPVAFVGTASTMRIAFRGSEIGSERIDTVERNISNP